MKFDEYLYETQMFVSISDPKIDILNNPYFVVKPYVLDNNLTYVVREPKEGEVKLVNCPQDEKAKFMKSNV